MPIKRMIERNTNRKYYIHEKCGIKYYFDSKVTAIIARDRCLAQYRAFKIKEQFLNSNMFINYPEDDYLGDRYLESLLS